MTLSHESAESRTRRTLKRYQSNLSQFGRRFARNKLAIISVFVIVALAAVAILADFLYNYDFITTVQLSNAFKGPGDVAKVTFQGKTFDHRYLLGADNYGRDILGRMIHGGRISLIIGFVTVAMSLAVGGFMGALAGYKGGFIDTIVMRVTDVMLSIPTILLSIAIVAALGNSFFNLLVAISTSMMPGYARIVRASVISVKDQEFIEAARCIGAGDVRIVFHHVLVNVMAPVIVQSTLNVGSAILWAAAPLLPRPGDSASDPGMGEHALRGERVHQVRAPTIAFSSPASPRHHDHCPGVQPHRRRPPGLPRPETEKVGTPWKAFSK